MASEAPSSPRKNGSPILKLVPSTSISLWWRQSWKHFWKIPVLSSHVCLLWQGTHCGSHWVTVKVSTGRLSLVEPRWHWYPPLCARGFLAFHGYLAEFSIQSRFPLASLACRFVASLLSCYTTCRSLVNHTITKNWAISKNDALPSLILDLQKLYQLFLGFLMVQLREFLQFPLSISSLLFFLFMYFNLHVVLCLRPDCPWAMRAESLGSCLPRESRVQ